MDWEIYDLLGFGGLTPEVVEYITAYLDVCSDLFDSEKIVRLFKRLEHFYVRWCDGEFIDAPPENLPQKKMRLLKEQLGDREQPLGQRQVDMYAGLNVMILLFELHRYAQQKDDLKDQINFHPCGQENTENFDEERLRCIIYRSYCLRRSFRRIVGPLLAGSNLSSASFAITSLSKVNLTDANLSKASAWGADLRDANLRNTNFSGATLAMTSLGGADLSGADLSSANLNRASLSSTNLSGANFGGASLKDISWNEDTNWNGVQGLETAIDVPEALKQQLENETLKIASASFHSKNLSDADFIDASLRDISWDEDTTW